MMFKELRVAFCFQQQTLLPIGGGGGGGWNLGLQPVRK
jgi:hypothetical protein